jgi:hypothetical protein
MLLQHSSIVSLLFLFLFSGIFTTAKSSESHKINYMSERTVTVDDKQSFER